MKFKNINIENILMNIFFSSVICLVMYLLTAVIVWYSDKILLHYEPAGIVALIGYFVVPFITIYLLFVEGKKL